MNAAVESLAVAPEHAISALRIAEAERTAAAETLSRGRLRLTLATEELEKITAENESAITRHAKRLETAAREGSTAPMPALALSDAHLARELTAQRMHRAAELMIANLEGSLAQANTSVLSAQRAVDAALSSLRAAEIDAAAESCVSLMEAFEEQMALCIVASNHNFGNDVTDNSAINRRLLATWNTWHTAGGQDLNTPLNRGEHPALSAARALLAEREQQLLAQEDPS